jgi:hypothetical protein
MTFDMLLGTLPGFVLLVSASVIIGLLYYGYRLYRPSRSRELERFN